MVKDIKEKLTEDLGGGKDITLVVKGMTDSDMEKVVQVILSELDTLQKRVRALEKTQ